MKNRLQFFSSFFMIFIFLGFTSTAFSQIAEIPNHYESYELQSGYFNGTGQAGSEAVNVFTGTIQFQNIPWLMVHFSKANLGENSYMIITSLYDNHWQKLDAVSIKQWNYFSAFFNGSAVEIKLFVAPLDKEIFFETDEVMVGEWVNNNPPESICGTTDDRIASDQQATGRLVSIGCTAWIIPNGKFVTAGHCLDATSGTVVEFQVPPSLPNGTIQHPGPEDQYSVDVASKIFVNGGVGNDWGVFEVFPNSITGLMPKEAQGAYWPLVQNLGPDSIRITGYGVDGPPPGFGNGARDSTNQTQQTHVGPNAGSSGTTMRYVTDTQGGNSGSPVIDALTNTAVGVHTHGGCTTSGGNNSGTSFFLSAFWDAVDQGAGGCPVEAASNPSPASGATDVSINISQLTWTNGAGAVTNEVYFGTDPGSLTLVQSGTLATSWSVTGPLNYSTIYYWRVDEIGDTCTTNGIVWSFSTEQDPGIVIDEIYCEDFETGAGNWTITNDGGTCTWAISDLSRPYTMPPTASGNVFAADADLCGSGTTLLSSAELDTVLDLSIYTSVWIEFDNDWRTIDAADEAYVEFTTDGGSTWSPVWSQVGVSVRNTHEAVDANIVAGQPAVQFRLRSVQPGWDWWWVVDNFCIYGSYVVPVELTSFAATVNEGNVSLNWATATETNNQGFDIERKLANSEFQKIGYVSGYGTSTESHSYTFTDKNISAGNYTYRLKQVDYDGTFEYSNEINVDVTVPLEFALDQNYPNPFNPSTTINFRLATDSKVSLKIFNVLGQEVETLINGNQAAGSHQVEFDASLLNSGVYFYRLEANSSGGNKFVDVKKMILNK